MTIDDPHGWRAGIRDNPVMRALDITVGRAGTDFADYVTSITKQGVETERVERGAYPDATLTVPEDMARALYDVLADYFNGTSGTRQLRADFNHERGRVDKLIDVVTTIAMKDIP